MGLFDWLWGGSASASADLSLGAGGAGTAPPPAAYVRPPSIADRLAHAAAVNNTPQPNGSRRFERFGGPRQRINTLMKGKNAFSPNRRNSLNMQNDGNLVVYNNSQAVWSTNTNGKKAARATMQPDGNLVVYDFFNKPLWASQTAGNPGAELYLQDDGNLTIFRAGNRREPTDILWSSGTLGRPNGESMALAAPPPPMTAANPYPIYGAGLSPVVMNAPPPPDSVTDMGDYDDITYYTEDNIPIQPPPAPQYWDNYGNLRAERAEERAARIAQWQATTNIRADRRQANQIARDIRHDEHGNIVSAAPVTVNPMRPDPSGGYHHTSTGEPVPIHPIVPPATPDPIVIPPSRVTNPIVNRSPIAVSPVMNPVLPSSSTIDKVANPSSLDTAKSGSLESGTGSNRSSGTGPTAITPVQSPAGHASGGGYQGGHGTVHAAGELFSDNESLGESELGGPTIGKRMGAYKYTVAGENDSGAGGMG